MQTRTGDKCPLVWDALEEQRRGRQRRQIGGGGWGVKEGIERVELEYKAGKPRNSSVVLGACNDRGNCYFRSYFYVRLKYVDNFRKLYYYCPQCQYLQNGLFSTHQVLYPVRYSTTKTAVPGSNPASFAHGGRYIAE